MSDLLESDLGRALSIRLKLQVSLSSLPVVEEWMDIHLTRWLESIPLPPEMPMGQRAAFDVAIASDLSRLRWSADGAPSGFVPKMSSYLQACRVSRQDVMLLDELGERLEPERVGSWIAVMGGGTGTGWQFSGEWPFATLAELFGEHEGKRTLTAWLDDAEVDTFRRFAQSIGDEVYSEVEFALPGEAADDQLSRASRASAMLIGSPLPEAVATAMATALSPDFTVTASIHGGAIRKLAITSPGLEADTVAQMCRALGLEYDSNLATLQSALGAGGFDRVEYSRVLAGDQTVQWVDVHIVPTASEGALPIEMN